MRLLSVYKRFVRSSYISFMCSLFKFSFLGRRSIYYQRSFEVFFRIHFRKFLLWSFKVRKPQRFGDKVHFNQKIMNKTWPFRRIHRKLANKEKQIHSYCCPKIAYSRGRSLCANSRINQRSFRSICQAWDDNRLS